MGDMRKYSTFGRMLNRRRAGASQRHKRKPWMQKMSGTSPACGGAVLLCVLLAVPPAAASVQVGENTVSSRGKFAR
jgi:hypothetical protein